MATFTQLDRTKKQAIESLKKRIYRHVLNAPEIPDVIVVHPVDDAKGLRVAQAMKELLQEGKIIQDRYRYLGSPTIYEV